MNRHAAPRYYHLQVRLLPDRVGQIRRILAAHLRYWGLDRLVPSASRGLGLLLEPVAAQGSPDEITEIETWWNGQHLITAISVAQTPTRPEHPIEPHHLAQIAAFSQGWGSCITGNHHLAWFSLRSSTQVREPLVSKTPMPSASEARPTPRPALTPAASAARRLN